MKLEIGAGERPAPGFLAVDVNPRHARVVASALELPFRSGSIEELRCVDVLEHISYQRVHEALLEWARVLRPGGKIYVQVPDAGTIMEWYAAGDERVRSRVLGGSTTRIECSRLEGAEWRLLGGHLDGRYAKEGDDFRWNAHFSLWDDFTIRAHMRGAGFRITRLRVNGHPNFLCDAVRSR